MRTDYPSAYQARRFREAADRCNDSHDHDELHAASVIVSMSEVKFQPPVHPVGWRKRALKVLGIPWPEEVEVVLPVDGYVSRWLDGLWAEMDWGIGLIEHALDK